MIFLIKPLGIQFFFASVQQLFSRAYDETYMLSRVERAHVCRIIELYGIPPATASHFKWINMKRLTFLLLIPAMICCEVQPSGNLKTNKSEIPESLHPKRPVTKTDSILPKETVVSEEIVPPPLLLEIVEMEEWPEPVEEIIDFPSIEVSFPGGSEALIEFINGQLHYPEIAIEMEVEGTVFVRFSIQKDGAVTRIQVIKGVNDALNREAKRVIRRMPKWIPAEEKGRKVESEYTIPIAFEIN
ncbi:MAG: protein TonB [Crocinitomicaceae bacterium]|jgi:protein TonB